MPPRRAARGGADSAVRMLAHRSIRVDGGFGARAEVPACRRSSTFACAGTRATGDDARAAHRPRHADAHGRGRHPRPARRRFLPLQRRRANGRSRTSKKCSTTTAPLLALYADAWRAPASRCSRERRARDRRWLQARNAARPRAVLFDARRRLRRRGRQVLRMDARRNARPAGAPNGGGAAPLGLDGPPNFESSALASARRSARWHRLTRPRLPSARDKLFHAARTAYSPRPRRQGADQLECAGDPGHGTGRRASSAAPTG